MKGKKHFGGKGGRKNHAAMHRGGGVSSPQTHGTHMPADEPIGRALKAGRKPGGRSSPGGKGRR